MLAASSRDHDFLLFLQHGFADIARGMGRLQTALATGATVIVNPGLGWFRTWWQLEPLIRFVADSVQSAFTLYPQLPAHVVAHSMGGLIWLELLDRRPDWRRRISSVTLIGSPVSGVAGWIDPLHWKPGILRDIEVDRTRLAERVAAEVPTLSIAGDFVLDTDGTVPVQSTIVPGAKSVVLPGIPHEALRRNPAVIRSILAFWNGLRS